MKLATILQIWDRRTKSIDSPNEGVQEVTALTINSKSILAALENQTHGGVDADLHKQAIIRHLRHEISRASKRIKDAKIKFFEDIVVNEIRNEQAILAALLDQDHGGIPAEQHKKNMIADMRMKILAQKTYDHIARSPSGRKLGLKYPIGSPPL